MRSAPGRVLMLSLLLLSSNESRASDPAGQRFDRFEGIATSPDGELLYRERHEIEYDEDRPLKSVTRYFDARGKKIAELRSDYRSSPYAPSYVFVDGVGRTRESAELLRKAVRLQNKIENRILSVPDTDAHPIVLGQGLHQLARAKLEDLAAGRELVVRLGIPSRLNLYELKIERDGSTDPGIVHLRIRINNWLLSLFAPSIEVDYDRRTRRLLTYRGVSNLEGPDGDPQKVVIRYVYEDGEMTRYGIPPDDAISARGEATR